MSATDQSQFNQSQFNQSQSGQHQPDQLNPDNLFGVCAALGEDFGFDPLWLRIALSAGVLWNPLAMLGLYVTLAGAVLATRLLFPDRKAAAPVDRPAAALSDAANTDMPVLARAA